MKIRNILKTFISSFLAGSMISLGGYVFLFCKFNFGITGSILGSFLFAFGLYSICTLKLNLYTGKIGFIIDKNKKNILYYIFDLLVMLIGNIIATILFGVVTYYLSNKEFINFIYEFFYNKNLNLSCLFLKSIGCGALVLLAVYMFNLSTDSLGKAISIFIPIGIFVLVGMDHCIANIYYMWASMCLIPYSFINIILSIIGNSIGAIISYSLIKCIKKQV